MLLPSLAACNDEKDVEPEPEIEQPNDPNTFTGTTGSLKWELKNGVLTVSGIGAMPNYKTGNTLDRPWSWARDEITSVVIGEGITNIGGHAFDGFYNLTSVTLPKTLKTIDGSAFQNCKKLTSIMLSEGLTDIEYEAFRSSGLTSLTLPNSLQTIGELAFANNESLKTVIIPGSIKTFGKSAFHWCPALDSLKLHEGLTIIREHSFSSCKSLTGVVFPESLKEIERDAFYASGLKSVTIPESVTFIGDCAFTNNPLKEIHLPWENPIPMSNSVYTWGEGTGWNNAKVTVYVPYGSKYKYQWMFFHGMPKFDIIERGSGNGVADAVINLGNGLYLPGKEFDPEGTLLKVKITPAQFQQMCVPGFGSVTEPAFQNVYKLFEDDFDFIYVLLDTLEFPKSLSFKGISLRVKNDIQGIGLSLTSDAHGRGLGQKLMGTIYIPRRGMVGDLFPHELCHGWSNYMFETYDPFIEKEIKGHWYVTHMPTGGGLLGGFNFLRTVETNSGGVIGKTKYQASDYETLNPDGSFKHPEIFGNNRQFSDIELYAMGLRSAQDLRDANFRMDILNNVIYDEALFIKEGCFYAMGRTSYTIDDVIRIHGPRVPDASRSPKTFKVLTMLFTTDVEKDCRDLVSSLAWIQGPPIEMPTYYSFRFATRDYGSVDFSGLRNSLKPQYKHLLEGK